MFVGLTGILLTNSKYTTVVTGQGSTLIDKQIAPGTSGSFDIQVDASEAEVGIDYVVEFSNISTNFPKNLKFYVD